MSKTSEILGKLNDKLDNEMDGDFPRAQAAELAVQVLISDNLERIANSLEKSAALLEKFYQFLGPGARSHICGHGFIGSTCGLCLRDRK